MKKLLTLIFALFLCVGLFAQTNDRAEDLYIRRRLIAGGMIER
jgi:hypothetical protein